MRESGSDSSVYVGRVCGGHMSERGKRASSSEMRFNVSESCDDGARYSFRVDDVFRLVGTVEAR